MRTSMFKIIICCSLLLIGITSCMEKQYKSGGGYSKLSKKAARANDYLAEQAGDIAKKNLDNNDTRFKKSRKRLEKEQNQRNEENTKKVAKAHTGRFIFY